MAVLTHSHLFETEHFQKFFVQLQKISPEYLTWSEAGGYLVCKQKPVNPSAKIDTLNTVEKVFKKLHLTMEPDSHKTKKHPDGTIDHIFTVVGIYGQLNRNEWIMKHIHEVVGKVGKVLRVNITNK